METTIKRNELIDRYYRIIIDISDKYFKGFAFFLAINAVLLGYLINSNVKGIIIDDSIRFKIISSGILTNVIFFLCTVYVYLLSLSVYKTYSKLALGINFEDSFIANRVNSDIKRGKQVYHITFLSVLLVVVLVIILYYTFY